MNDIDIIRKTSKFLSLVLRHNPAKIGLTLDSEGWADVNELLNKMGIEYKMLNNVVETDNKKRYSFNGDKTKIRANQGHSIKVNLGLDSITPPDVLFHGTATRFLNSIYDKGICKMKRHHVHLSANKETAVNVGKRHDRHGNAIVLEIDAKQMHKDGHKFYRSNNGVWLTDVVDSMYIKK